MDHGPWETGIGEAEVPPAPCRSIEITPGVRALDQAQQRAREATRPVWLRPERPAPAAAEPTIAKVVRMNHKPQRRSYMEQCRFSNCPWCDVRLPSKELRQHRPTCPKKPAR